MDAQYVVGVDVGTGSVRAALFTINGEQVKMDTCSIQTWNPKAGYYHQSSENIWDCCCKVIKVVYLSLLIVVLDLIILLIQEEFIRNPGLLKECEIIIVV